MSDTIFSYYKLSIPDNKPIAPTIKDSLNLKEHLGRLDSAKTYNGYIGIQIDRPPKDSSGPFSYRVSYSFCSPADNFSRKTARNICRSRADGRHLTIESDTQLNARDLSEMAINLVHEPSFGKCKAQVSGIKIPNWFSLTPRKQITPHMRYRKSKK